MLRPKYSVDIMLTWNNMIIASYRLLTVRVSRQTECNPSYPNVRIICYRLAVDYKTEFPVQSFY